jgi:hypothetical protein
MMQKAPDPSLRQNSPAPQDPCWGAWGAHAWASLAQVTEAIAGGGLGVHVPPLGVGLPTKKVGHATGTVGAAGAATQPVRGAALPQAVVQVSSE